MRDAAGRVSLRFATTGAIYILSRLWREDRTLSGGFCSEQNS
jgi:hypothetical protein